MEVQRRILYVGTSPSTVASLRDRLSGDSYTIAVQNDIDAAMDRITVVDCIVSEFDLPDGDGLELLTQVQEQRRSLPCLLFAEDGSERLAQAAIRAGVTDYVSPETADGEVETALATALTRVCQESLDDSREQELATFRLAVEQAGHSIYITDMEGVIQYVNPAFEELTGYTASEALGHTPALFHPDDADEPWWQEMWAEQPRQGVVTKRRKSGEEVIVDQTVAPIMNQQHTSVEKFVVVQRDITQRKERERHLAVLSRVFRHNVRNLLTTLSCDTIPQDAGHTLTADQRQRIESAIAQLSSLSENAYDINQLLRREDTTHNVFPVDALLGTLIDRYANQYPDADLTLSAPDGVRIRADPLIEKGFAELLSNAITHNDADQPRVDVSVTTSDDSVLVRLVDNGNGIPPDDAAVLTNDLEITQLNHSSGLGLWLAYWSITKSGGTVSTATGDEDGTTIEVIVPMADEASQEQSVSHFGSVD